MRILFWGTPEFAVPSFRALLGEGHDVVSVVTQPDRPAGRGRKPQAPAMKRAAEQELVPVLQPESPRADGFETTIRVLEPELSIVVAYGHILRREILDIPARGSVNLHASLLPSLRGAAPIAWAIANGDAMTGVTVMRMTEGMDAGPILHQVAEPIAAEETATDLATRLSELGAEALVEALALLEADALEAVAQDDARATFAPRITREHTRIDWTLPAVAVGARVRAFDARPGAWTTLNGREIKLFRPLPEPKRVHAAPPGTVLEVHATDASEGMLVACGRGAVWIREVTPSGTRRMRTSDWVRGRGAQAGDRLG